MNAQRVRPNDGGSNHGHGSLANSTTKGSPGSWTNRPKLPTRASPPPTSPLSIKQPSKCSSRAKKNTVVPATGAISSSSRPTDRGGGGGGMFSPVRAGSPTFSACNPFRHIRVQQGATCSQPHRPFHNRIDHGTSWTRNGESTTSTAICGVSEGSNEWTEPKTKWFATVRVLHALDLYQPCVMKQKLITPAQMQLAAHHFLPQINLTVNNQTTSHRAAHHAQNHSIWVHSQSCFALEHPDHLSKAPPTNLLVVSCWTCCCTFPILIGETKIRLDNEQVRRGDMINGFFPLCRIERQGRTITKYITGKVKLIISFDQCAATVTPMDFGLLRRKEPIGDQLGDRSALEVLSRPAATSIATSTRPQEIDMTLEPYDTSREDFEADEDQMQEECPTATTLLPATPETPNHDRPMRDEQEEDRFIPVRDEPLPMESTPPDVDHEEESARQGTSVPDEESMEPSTSDDQPLESEPQEPHHDDQTGTEHQVEPDESLTIQRPTQQQLQIPFSPIKFNVQEMQRKRQQLRSVVPPNEQQRSREGAQEEQAATSPMAKPQLTDQEIQMSKEALEQLREDTKAFELSMNQLELREVVGEGVYSCVREAELTSDESTTPRVVAIKQFRFQCAIVHDRTKNLSADSSTEFEADPIDSSHGDEDERPPQLIVPLKILRLFDREVRFLEQVVENSHFVHLIGIVVNPPMLGIVTDFFPQGSLFHCMKQPALWSSMTMETKLTLAVQISSGVEFLHAHHIVHRDLKAHNILVENLNDPERSPVIKICDLGSAASVEDNELLHEEIGSRGYTAPEILLGTGYNSKVDSWSFGILLWEMTRSTAIANPLESMSNEQFVEMMQQTSKSPVQASAQGEEEDQKEDPGEETSMLPVVTPPLDDQQKELLQPLLHGCWHKDPAKRWDMSQIIGELEILMYQVDPTHREDDFE